MTQERTAEMEELARRAMDSDEHFSDDDIADIGGALTECLAECFRLKTVLNQGVRFAGKLKDGYNYRGEYGKADEVKRWIDEVREAGQ